MFMSNLPYKPTIKISAKSLALHTQAVIQGAFILAKASGKSEIVADSIDHFKKVVFNYYLIKITFQR